MSASTVPSVGPWPLVTASRHWRLVLVVLLGLGPFVPSILAMQDFLLADNALGFTPFALVAAAYLFWVRAHSDEAPKPRDILVDLFYIVPLVLLVFFILFVPPGAMSWYFGLNRIDLAALAPWALGVAFAFLGYQQVLRTWPTWIVLIFAWPYPAVRLQSLLADLFVPITAWTGQFVVEFARLPYAPSSDSQVFTSTHLPEADNFTLVVGQLCSGTSTTIGFLIIGGGLMLLSRGNAASRMRWLIAGTVLAFLMNLVRVSALLIAATSVSRDFAVDTLHPILGLVLFILVVIVMLLLMRPFVLRFDPVPHGRRLAWEPSPGGGKALRIVWVLMVAAGVGVGSGVVQAQELDFIGIGDGVPAVALESKRTNLPAPPG
jgi:exosortase/archaeosortase family protein